MVKTPGTFDSLYKFLTLLENSPYELEFVGMDLTREGDFTSVAVETPADGTGAQTIVPPSIKIPRWQATFDVRLLSFIQ